jgi:uncharacterized protein YndB with AHSA1/START domain
MPIDPASALGAETRLVATRDHEGKPARVVVATRTYPTHVEDLWDALTNPERIPRWFLPISGDLRPGGRYKLEGNAEGTVTECAPPHRLALTWENGGSVSWLTVRLERCGDGTRLELDHVAHVEDELWDRFGPGAVGVGWDGALMALGLHVSSGGTADPAEMAAWPATEAGAAFTRACSQGWAQASIAAGTPEAAALAAAERTTAFYTGQ